MSSHLNCLLLLEILHWLNYAFFTVDRDRSMQTGLKRDSHFIDNVKNMIEIPK
jgi:hypothetical protein